MTNHHPKPWLAAVLGLFFGPLGFLYAGRFGLAIGFFFFTLGIRIAAYVTSGGVSLFASIAELACWIGGAGLAWYLAKKRPAGEPRWTSRWYGMTAVALALAACVYLSRLFFFEPFLVPSSAMLPTASRGDRLLVKKLGYGHLSIGTLLLGRLPAVKPLARGELVVFEDPVKRGQIAFKRVAGIQGDEVAVRGARLAVNGRDTRVAELGMDAGAGTPRMRERLGDTVFETLAQKQAPARLEEPMAFPLRERCSFTREEMRCVVPPGFLFVLGDHRDLSQDSRYYGFVRADQVIGKVVGVYPNGAPVRN
jgi:signal peptidase I